MKKGYEMNDMVSDVCYSLFVSESSLREDLSASWSRWFPEMKDYQISRVVDYQVDTLLPGLLNQWFQRPNEPMFIEWYELRNHMGRVTANGKKEWVASLMGKYPELCVVTIDFKGKEGRATRCSFNTKYHGKIMNEIVDLNKEFDPSALFNIKNDPSLITWSVPVDVACLRGYVDATKDDIQKAKESIEIAQSSGNEKEIQNKMRYHEVLVRNRTIAEYLLSIVESDDEGDFLTEYYSVTDSGRIYGKGFSLQRCPKQVRHAALGLSYQYDFQASSYALLAGLAHTVNTDLQIPSVLEYVKHRASIRTQIARETGIFEDKIKAVFNSLGFGASTHDNPYTSIRGELYADQYETLMNNREFKAICKEMDLIRDTLNKHFTGEFELMGKKYSENDPNSESKMTKKRNKNQKLAWIYQVLESTAIDLFMNAVNERSGGVTKAVLMCHDCAYYTNPIGASTFEDAVYLLRSNSPVFKYVKVEKERVVPRSFNIVAKGTDEYDQMVKEHKELMGILNTKEVEQDSELKFYDSLIGELGSYSGQLGTSIDTNEA